MNNGFKRLSAFIAAVLLVCGLAGCSKNEIGDSRGDTESGQFSESIRSSNSDQSSDNVQSAENSQSTESSQPTESNQLPASAPTSDSKPTTENSDKTENLKSSEVEAANKMAADGKKLFEEILADTKIKGDGVNSDVVVVTADNGVWSCMTDGEGYPEELLRSVFAQKYKNLKNAAFCFVVFSGKCTGAIYLSVPYSEIDEGFEIFDLGINGGKFPVSCKWSGDEAGIVVSKETGKTYVVGTSPVVEMNDAAVVRYDDDAHTYAYKNAKAMYRSLNNFLDGMENIGLRIKKLDEPHMILINVSYGRYGVDFDDELMIDAESMAKFCMRLTHAVEDEYKYSDAWIKAYIVNGKCEGVVFMSSDIGDVEHPFYEDFKKGSYRWDSADDIGSVNGITMGVYPELSYSKN